MIVQHLHHIQAQHGYLPQSDLRTLARRLDVPLHRIQEVASTFPHFRFDQPAHVEVHVCRDMACHLRGSADLIASLQQTHGAGTGSGRTCEVRGVSCLGRCDRAPAVRVGDRQFLGRSAAGIAQIVQDAVDGRDVPAPDLDTDRPRPAATWLIDVYAHETHLQPYEAVRRFVRQYPSHESLLEQHPGNAGAIGLLQELKTAGLLGMGGAGAPAFTKWRDVLEARGAEKYIVVNGDESEPATFKDREILIHAPHLLVEGVLLAGLLTNATRGYIYIRHEYEEQIASVQRAIEAARAIRACGERIFGTRRSFSIEVFVSPGGYICGEQSALLEAMEDRRAEPRNRPPELATNGLYDKPTLLSNVETFSWVPAIALRGGAAYRDAGRSSCRGRRLFSICGDLGQPGVHEVPIGITLGELIDDHCGGMREGRALKALAPSGPSGGFLPARFPAPPKWKDRLAKKVADMKASKAEPGDVELLDRFVTDVLGSAEPSFDLRDLPLDLTFFRHLGLMLGAGLVVYGEGANIAAETLNALEFYRRESCGKCVPCRLGTERLVEWATALQSGRQSKAWLARLTGDVRALSSAMEQTSICGLGAVAFNPLKSLLEYFPEDVGTLLASESRPQEFPS